MLIFPLYSNSNNNNDNDNDNDNNTNDINRNNNNNKNNNNNNKIDDINEIINCCKGSRSLYYIDSNNEGWIRRMMK